MVKIFCFLCIDVKYIDDEECFEFGELFVFFFGNFIVGLLFGIWEYLFVIEYIFGDIEFKMIVIEIMIGEKISCILEMKEDSNK